MLVAYIFIFMCGALWRQPGVLRVDRLEFPLVLWLTIALIAVYTSKAGCFPWFGRMHAMRMLLGGGLLLYFLAAENIPGGGAAMEAANPRVPFVPRPAIRCAFLGLVWHTGVFLFYQPQPGDGPARARSTIDVGRHHGDYLCRLHQPGTAVVTVFLG